MLFRSGDKESRISMKTVEIRGNDRRRRNPEISQKREKTENRRKPGKRESAEKGGPSPAPPGDPFYFWTVG